MYFTDSVQTDEGYPCTCWQEHLQPLMLPLCLPPGRDMSRVPIFLRIGKIIVTYVLMLVKGLGRRRSERVANPLTPTSSQTLYKTLLRTKYYSSERHIIRMRH